MYAVVSSGGKQYRVEAGSELIIERPGVDDGATITFDRVLLVGDGEAVTVGTPTVKGATVSGTVLGEALGPKLIIFKFKQKATYRRKNGHRQHLTRVRIDEISADGKSTRADTPDKAENPDKAEKPDTADTATKATTETATRKPARKPAAKASTAKAAKTESTDEAKPKAAPRKRATPAKAAKAKE